MALDWLDAKRAATAKLVIARLDKVLGLTEDGSVSLGFGGDYDMGVAIIADCARFSEGVPEYQRIHIARRAVIESKKAGEFNDDRFDVEWERLRKHTSNDLFSLMSFSAQFPSATTKSYRHGGTTMLR